jgi:hypothetical protein
VKPPKGYQPQHRRSSKRKPYEPPQPPSGPCSHGLFGCPSRHLPIRYAPGVAPAKPNPAETLTLQRPEWLR